MQNASQDESKAGIKISKRNINNLRYANEIPGDMLQDFMKTKGLNHPPSVTDDSGQGNGK